jgi:hypothetical protein
MRVSEARRSGRTLEELEETGDLGFPEIFLRNAERSLVIAHDRAHSWRTIE